MTLARCPVWAINGGFPAPEPGELFDTYWSRVGANAQVIRWAKMVRKGAEDVANDRMATWLRLMRPGLFLEELDRMAFRANIPPHRIGVR